MLPNPGPMHLSLGGTSEVQYQPCGPWYSNGGHHQSVVVIGQTPHDSFIFTSTYTCSSFHASELHRHESSSQLTFVSSFLLFQNPPSMILGQISYLDCIAFLVFLTPQLLIQVGLIRTATWLLGALPSLSEFACRILCPSVHIHSRPSLCHPIPIRLRTILDTI